jgi:hypothetical protein
VRMIGDGETQVGYSVAGRLRGRMMLCVVCTMHEETRSVSFLVEPQNQGRRFVSDLASKSLRWFVSGLASKTTETVCQWFGYKTTRMVFSGSDSKPVGMVSPCWPSKPVVALGSPVWASKLAAMV